MNSCRYSLMVIAIKFKIEESSIAKSYDGFMFFPVDTV